MTNANDRWSVIHGLFDELLDLAPASRAERLAGVRERDASLAIEVDQLLQQHAQVVRDRFLEDEPDRPMAGATLEGRTIGPYSITVPMPPWSAAAASSASRKRVAFLDA